MWFLLIRPQQQRVRAQRSLLDALTIGDQVVTAGGILGEVTALTDQEVTLQVNDGVQIRFVRAAIRQRLTPDADPSTADPIEDES